MKSVRAAFLVLSLGPLVLIGAEAAASPSSEDRRVVVRKTGVPTRREQPPHERTKFFSVYCRKGYTAVSGNVLKIGSDTVVVASHPLADDPEEWEFEFSNYGTRGDIVEVVVVCVKGAASPARFFLRLAGITLQPGETRKREVLGPRFASPLGFGFRMRSADGKDPPPAGSRPYVFSALPHGRGYTLRIENRSDTAIRVEASTVFVRRRATERQTGRTLLSRVKIVSVVRTAGPGLRIAAAAVCPSGSTGVASSSSPPSSAVSAKSSVRGRGFRFEAFNNSDSPSRIRFHGLCLSKEVR